MEKSLEILAETVENTNTTAVVDILKTFLQIFDSEHLNAHLLHKSNCRLFSVEKHVFLVAPSKVGLGVFAVTDVEKNTSLGAYNEGGIAIYGEVCFEIFAMLFPQLHPYALEIAPRGTIVDWRGLTGKSSVPKRDAERECLTTAFENSKLLAIMTNHSFCPDWPDYRTSMLDILREDEQWDRTWETSLNLDYLDRFVPKFCVPVKIQTKTYEDNIPLEGFLPRLNQGDVDYLRDGFVSLGPVNANFINKHTTVIIETTCDIPSGQEVLIDYGRGYHENVNKITVQQLQEHVLDPMYRRIMLDFVDVLDASCLGGARTFIEGKSQLVKLLQVQDPMHCRLMQEQPELPKKKRDKKPSFKVGDLLMYFWNGAPWPCVVISQTTGRIGVQWLTCCYPDEFDDFFATTANLQTRRLKSQHAWFEEHPNLVPIDLKTNDFYYLFRHYEDETTVPATLSETELIELKKLIGKKKMQLKPLMDKKRGQKVYVDDLLKKNNADVVSLIQQCKQMATKSQTIMENEKKKQSIRNSRKSMLENKDEYTISFPTVPIGITIDYEKISNKLYVFVKTVTRKEDKTLDKILVGDRIMKINGKDLTSMEQLRQSTSIAPIHVTFRKNASLIGYYTIPERKALLKMYHVKRKRREKKELETLPKTKRGKRGNDKKPRKKRVMTEKHKENLRKAREKSLAVRRAKQQAKMKNKKISNSQILNKEKEQPKIMSQPVPIPPVPQQAKSMVFRCRVTKSQRKKKRQYKKMRERTIDETTIKIGTILQSTSTYYTYEVVGVVAPKGQSWKAKIMQRTPVSKHGDLIDIYKYDQYHVLETPRNTKKRKIVRKKETEIAHQLLQLAKPRQTFKCICGLEFKTKQILSKHTASCNSRLV